MTNKANLIIHPVRMRLVAEIVDRPMTTRQLAAALPDIAQATLYRQIKRLHEGGIFQIVQEQEIKGAIERTYALVPQQNRLTAAEIAELTAEEHVQYFSIFTAGLIEAFQRQVMASEDTAGFVQSGTSYNQAVVYLSDEERAEFQEKLLEVVGQIMSFQPSPERKRYTLASIVIPDERG